MVVQATAWLSEDLPLHVSRPHGRRSADRFLRFLCDKSPMKLQPKTKPTRRDAREALSEVAAIRAAYWGDVNRWGYRGGRARVVVVVR